MTRRKKEWYQSESFWRELYPAVFPPKRFEDAEKDAALAVALARPPGCDILDLCCGPGRISVALARGGFDVTGVDATKYLLEKARSRGRAEKVRVEWVLEDARDFVRPESFDLALSIYTSFGYFEDQNDDLCVLKNVFESLRPQGVCLIEVMSKEIVARVFTHSSCSDLEDGWVLLERREIFADWTRLRNDWTLVKNGRAKTFSFHQRIYSGQELRDLMERAGFTGVRLYGNLYGDPYDLYAQNLVIVGEKP